MTKKQLCIACKEKIDPDHDHIKILTINNTLVPIHDADDCKRKIEHEKNIYLQFTFWGKIYLSSITIEHVLIVLILKLLRIGYWPGIVGEMLIAFTFPYYASLATNYQQTFPNTPIPANIGIFWCLGLIGIITWILVLLVYGPKVYDTIMNFVIRKPEIAELPTEHEQLEPKPRDFHCLDIPLPANESTVSVNRPKFENKRGRSWTVNGNTNQHILRYRRQ